ncbi:pirin family protein [Paenibacillus aurantius]|uniref:Pirin family protein n=1 Tax=Paenibacillus aurantius TaxID=2918900 RepID=A0AA96RGK4_9BACL|nr:pirin family protein [Paenibacillus aurantius]WNQ10139.1 pirin family protein [Paenibacillus aurantius]
MINLYPASSRYSADHGWLKSNFSFSFADYYDPSNTEFGPMRVLNDDEIAGHRGFGAHPHREMEIVSIVLQGKLKHEDSTGRTAITGFGEVQRMSAGTGIIHSETNPGEEEVHLMQMWFTPEEKGLEPSYETTRYDVEAMKNALLPVVSKNPGENVARIHQDMTIYLSDLEARQSIGFQQPAGRRIFVFVIEGTLAINEQHVLGRRDSARITETPELTLSSEGGARFMLIDLP